MHKLAVFAFALAAACGPTGSGLGGDDDDDGSGAPDAGGTGFPDGGGPDEFADAAPAEQCDKMDILFVIDNSGSMSDEQMNLAQNFPLFVDVLDDSGLDYRVGITTTGMDYQWEMWSPIGPIPNDQDGGDNGALLQRCSMSRRWVEKSDPDPAGDFSCAATVGDSGPSKEMPLEAVKTAFSDRLGDGTNAGFLRDDALLGIVIMTDEDDCSYEQSVTLGLGESLCDDQMEPVSTYVSFLDGLTGDRGRWATAVIAGPGPDSCSSNFGNAEEASRLIDFVGQTGANAVLSSICEGDLTLALQDALETFDSACQTFPPID